MTNGQMPGVETVGEMGWRVTEAIKLLADKAQEMGATASDKDDKVRVLVLSNGLGFNAWFCVCCELADREARAQGWKDQFDRAAHSPKFKAALLKYQESL